VVAGYDIILPRNQREMPETCRAVVTNFHIIGVAVDGNAGAIRDIQTIL